MLTYLDNKSILQINHNALVLLKPSQLELRWFDILDGEWAVCYCNDQMDAVLRSVKPFLSHERCYCILGSLFECRVLWNDDSTHVAIGSENPRQVQLQWYVKHNILRGVGCGNLGQDGFAVVVAKELLDLILDEHTNILWSHSFSANLYLYYNPSLYSIYYYLPQYYNLNKIKIKTLLLSLFAIKYSESV